MDIGLRDSDRLDDALRMEAAKQEVTNSCLARTLRVAGVDLAGPSTTSCVFTCITCLATVGHMFLSIFAFTAEGDDRSLSSQVLEIIMWNFIWFACYTYFFLYRREVQRIALREFAAILARYHRSELFAEQAASSSSSSLDTEVHPLSDGRYTTAASAMVPRPGHETVKERKSDNISACEASCICCYEHAGARSVKPTPGKLRVHKWKGNRWRRTSVIVPDSAAARVAVNRHTAADTATHATVGAGPFHLDEPARASKPAPDVAFMAAEQGGSPVKRRGIAETVPAGLDSKQQQSHDEEQKELLPLRQRLRAGNGVQKSKQSIGGGQSLHNTASAGSSDLTFEAEAADALLDNLTLQALRPFPEELEQLRAALEALPPQDRPAGALRVHRARFVQATLIWDLLVVLLLAVSTASLVIAADNPDVRKSHLVESMSYGGFAVLQTILLVLACCSPLGAIVAMGSILSILASEPSRIRATLQALSTIKPVHHRALYNANLDSLMQFQAHQQAIANGHTTNATATANPAPAGAHANPISGQQQQQQLMMMRMMHRAPSGISTQAFLDDALTPFEGRLVSKPAGPTPEPAAGSEEVTLQAMMLAANAGALDASHAASGRLHAHGGVAGSTRARRASMDGFHASPHAAGPHAAAGVPRIPSAPALAAAPSVRQGTDVRVYSALQETNSGGSQPMMTGSAANHTPQLAMDAALASAAAASAGSESSSIGERRLIEAVRGKHVHEASVKPGIQRRRQLSAGDAQGRTHGIQVHGRRAENSNGAAMEPVAVVAGSGGGVKVVVDGRVGLRSGKGSSSAHAGLTHASAAAHDRVARLAMDDGASGIGSGSRGGMVVVAGTGAGRLAGLGHDARHTPDLRFGVSRDQEARAHEGDMMMRADDDGVVFGVENENDVPARTMEAALRRRGATLRPWLRVFDAQLARIRAQRRTARRITHAFSVAAGVTTVLMLLSGLGFVTLSTSAAVNSSGGPIIPLMYAGVFFFLSQLPLLKSAFYTHSLRQPMLVITASPAGVLAQCSAIRAAEVSVMLAARAEADAVSICGAVIDPSSAIRLASLEISLVVLALQQLNSGAGILGATG